jgi:hypothetical protein
VVIFVDCDGDVGAVEAGDQRRCGCGQDS